MTTLFTNGNLVDVIGQTVLLSLINISEPTRQAENSYAVFCLKKKNKAHIKCKFNKQLP